MDIDPKNITIDQLTRLAIEGQLSKETMARLLVPERRQAYADACSAIETVYTHECRANGEPCLVSGCSIDHEHGEICLQPILNAGVEYHKKCAAEWMKFFTDPGNRIDAWKH